MVDRAALAKIHIAKKELNLTDEAYRDMLHLHFQVSSAKDLKPQQVIVLLNKFRAKGWRPKTNVKNGRKGTGKSANFKEIVGPNARQKKYILALWNALGYDVAKLDARCKKQFNVERFEWLKDEHDLFVLVTDLRQRCLNAGIDPEPN
ncbi:MAG: regulatory protein GemA [Planctomycetes bacterium]|nr:regulatory protein GemA [Planctomycetota bacterium]